VLTIDIGAMVLGAAVTPILLRVLGLDGTLILMGVGVPLLVVLTSRWWARMDREAITRLKELAPRLRMLEAMGIFAQASPPVLERLAAAAEDVVAPAGTVIVHEGDPADALYVIADGEVAVSARGDGDTVRPLATLTAPGYFGEIGLLEQIPRTATVETLSATTLYRIDGDTFLDALTSTPASPAFVESSRLRLARTKPSSPHEAESPEPGPAPTDDEPVA
jgi:hypothetical protein